MNVIIFGCGRTGAYLALGLAKNHHVTVIEQNPEALRRLGYKHNCKVVLGSGLDTETLEKANISNCDVFFALTRGDNTNLMAAQVAKLTYGVKEICIRVADPLRAQAYQQMGYFCITPSVMIGGMLRDWVNETPYSTIDTYNDLPKEIEL